MSGRYLIIFLILLSCVQAKAQPQADIRLEDYTYDEDIRTVLLYPSAHDKENPARLLRQPVVPLQEDRPLTLEFDDLKADYRSYRAKIIHCNADWSRSQLSDVEFTYEFNDYPVTEYSQSFSTKIPYYHYLFDLPRLKLPGNYVLLVYAERERTPVLTRRFMIYDPKVRIHGEVRFSQGITERRTHQEVNFGIDYRGYTLSAPQNDLQVVIRQNFRWDTAKSGFKPTAVNPFEQSLSYQFFRLENNFPGGNEFRYFDSRTLMSRGYGIQHIERSDDYTQLVLAMDKPRSGEVYFQSDDFNGNYIVGRREPGNASVEADYTPVLFSLRMNADDRYDLYVNGAFNLWQLNDQNRMDFNPDLGAYHATIWLKQGVINYDYVAVDRVTGSKTSLLLEGNHGATENDYDVLVYHRPPAARADLLIGYRTFEWNRR